MLDGAQTFEGPVHHDGQSSAERLTLFHAGNNNNNSISHQSPFLSTAVGFYFNSRHIPTFTIRADEHKAIHYRHGHGTINNTLAALLLHKNRDNG